MESQGLAMTITLWQGDCLEYMKSMPNGSVDLIFTSPPFKDKDVEEEYWIVYEKWMKEINRISKVAIIINSATRLNTIIQRWPPKRTMIWGKGISKYSWRWNPIFIYENGEYKINKVIWSDCFGVSSIYGGNKSHKYQDPELLYFTIIKMFSGLQNVFDPFMGSGTTGLACLQLGKDFIGCEINPDYFIVAKNNIEQMQLFTSSSEKVEEKQVDLL